MISAQNADDVTLVGIAGLAEMMASGGLTSVALTSAFLDRIDALDGELHSYVCTLHDSAMAQAKLADRERADGRLRSSLHGIPIAVKDLADMQGVVTTAGMPLMSDKVAKEDSTVVRRLRDAGAVILGKLTMTEGAMTLHHPSVEPPRNPWSANHSPGFSSSGSGVAVAACLCVAAIGSDTGGSIRLPSAFNGVTGLKPTWGRVSRHGIFPLVEGLDTVGPIARSAADAAAILSIIAGFDHLDPTTSRRPVPDYVAEIEHGIVGMRIGVDWLSVEEGCEGEIVDIIRATAAVLERSGAHVVPVTLPRVNLSRVMALMVSGVADAHRETWPGRADEYGPALARMLGASSAIEGRDVAAAINLVNVFKGEMAGLLEAVDLVLTPVTSGPTPAVNELEEALGSDAEAMNRRSAYTLPFNLSGQPTVTFPAGLAAGLPAAAQLVGNSCGEAGLLCAAHAFQSKTDWHLRRPDLG